MIDLLRRLLGARPCKISLLHATRGRPEEPLKCRALWYEQANHPDRVEHLFAIDDDDEIGKAALAEYSPLVVKTPGLGCVGAWNLAAERSTGDILIQLSDDWLPVRGWDDLLEAKFAGLRKPKVLQISDGHRTDDLFCMAIINRKRLQQVGHFLPPAYTGIFSDDEFSYRAFEDGVVVPAREIQFVHDHPNYNPSKEMDETYMNQNKAEKHREAKAIFVSRNPEAKKRWFVKDHWERRWQPNPKTVK
jgi:hypothetical protein